MAPRGATRATLDLLAHWRRDGRQQRLFFAQLEAAETVIFLQEARADLLQGVDVPPEAVPDGVDVFTRYGCKMATGSGKTTVMAMLTAWSILNKVAARGDARFSDVVVVVCPNLTIRERLTELDPSRGDASIYRTRDLVPSDLMPSLRRGRVLVKNWHEFERKGMSAGAKVQKNGVRETIRATIKIGDKTTSGRGGRYMTEQALELALAQETMRVVEDKRPKKPELVVEETRYVESDAKLMQRLLGREVGGKKNLLVLNDEAHHAYRIRQESSETADEDAEWTDEERAEELAYESTVWIDGLDRIHKHRRINFCIDLSATPYYLARAGEDTNRVFPWVVSDFGLTDAIESGLVKIPQLAHSDPSGEEQAKYFNIWRWIMSQLTAVERGGKRANAKPEAVLKWAAPPIQLLAGRGTRFGSSGRATATTSGRPCSSSFARTPSSPRSSTTGWPKGRSQQGSRRPTSTRCATSTGSGTRSASTPRSSARPTSRAQRTTSRAGCASRSTPSASATGRATRKGALCTRRDSRSWR